MFDYFRNCSSNPHQGIYHLCSVQWPCSSLKVTTASQVDKCEPCTVPAISGTILWNLYCASYIWDNIVKLVLCQLYLGHYLSYVTQSWHDGRLVHGIYAHARFDDLHLDPRSYWVSKGTHAHIHSGLAYANLSKVLIIKRYEMYSFANDSLQRSPCVRVCVSLIAWSCTFLKLFVCLLDISLVSGNCVSSSSFDDSASTSFRIGGAWVGRGQMGRTERVSISRGDIDW